jgi:hypothetical protein
VVGAVAPCTYPVGAVAGHINTHGVVVGAGRVRPVLGQLTVLGSPLETLTSVM